MKYGLPEIWEISVGFTDIKGFYLVRLCFKVGLTINLAKPLV